VPVLPEHARAARLALPATCPRCGADTRAERLRTTFAGPARLGRAFLVWCAARCGWQDRYEYVPPRA